MARFLVEEEGRPTRSYRLITDAIVIGRIDTADLVLPDTGVSRKHALVARELGAWVISDNESANGLSVNGQATEKAPLNHGDVVGIGKFILIFQTDDEAELPEYTDPNAGIGDDQTSPGVPIGDLDTLRSLDSLPNPEEVDTLKEVPPEAAGSHSASATMAPMPSAEGAGAPRLVGDDGVPFEVGEGLRFGKDLPVEGVLPFVSPGAVLSVGGGAVARRGSFLIPMYVNGASISSQRLKDGDEVRVGSTVLTYRGP